MGVYLRIVRELLVEISGVDSGQKYRFDLTILWLDSIVNIAFRDWLMVYIGYWIDRKVSRYNGGSIIVMDWS